MFTFLLSTLLITAAPAQSLPTGWRGAQFGTLLDKAPQETCIKGTEPGVGWICSEALGEDSFTITYMVQPVGPHIFVGIMGEGPESMFSFVEQLLVASWGPGMSVPSMPKDHVWGTPGTVMGRLNVKGQVCNILLVDTVLTRAAAAAQARALGL